jgi:hypothetical protein
MEFDSREACIRHYSEQFPNLPRYVVEMALDYDLQCGEGSSTNEKPLTNAQKRKNKKAKAALAHEPTIKRDINDRIADALKTGKRLELDCAKVLTAEEYEMPPMMKGYIACDGAQLEDITDEKDLPVE